MAGNHHHSDGRTGTTGTGNVVPLRPRQWLDSEDELVPIAGLTAESGDDPGAPDTSARAPDRNGSAPATTESGTPDDAGHASTWLGAGEHTVPIARPPTADATSAWAASDFWGEDAANVHDAVEAPVPGSSSQHSLDPAPLDPAPQPGPESRRLVRGHRLPRPPALVAIAVGAAAIVAATLSGFTSAPAAPRGSAPTASIHTPATARARATTGKAATAAKVTRPRATAAARSHTTSDRSRLRRRSRSAASHLRPHHQRHRPVVTGTAARYVASAPPSTAASTSTSAPTTSTVAPTGSTSASSTSRAGPTGPVSLLGAGTSPSG